MSSWKYIWRKGFAPDMPTAGLEALVAALQTDSPLLIQGSTTMPPPMPCVELWPVEAADAIGFIGWQGNNLSTVGEVEEFFARACYEADERLGEPAACRWFLNWFDDAPRGEVRGELLNEVRRTLEERRAASRVIAKEQPVHIYGHESSTDTHTIALGCDNPDEQFRIERLHRVIGYIKAISDDLRIDVLSKVSELNDRKGWLTVLWNDEPCEVCREAFEKAWANSIGDGTDNAISHFAVNMMPL